MHHCFAYEASFNIRHSFSHFILFQNATKLLIFLDLRFFTSFRLRQPQCYLRHLRIFQTMAAKRNAQGLSSALPRKSLNDEELVRVCPITYFLQVIRRLLFTKNSLGQFLFSYWRTWLVPLDNLMSKPTNNDRYETVYFQLHDDSMFYKLFIPLIGRNCTCTRKLCRLWSIQSRAPLRTTFSSGRQHLPPTVTSVRASSGELPGKKPS